MGSGAAQPGAPVAIRSSSTRPEIEVRVPSGEMFTVPRGRMNTFQFSRTGEIGVYDVSEESQVTQQFAINLFDGSESDVRVRSEPIQIGYVGVEGEPAWEPARRELWKLLLLLALAVLLVEWYIYNKRVYI